MSAKGTPIPRKLSVDEISFSAHVDYSQNSEFIEMVKAQHIVRPPFALVPNTNSWTRARSSYTESRPQWAGCVLR